MDHMTSRPIRLLILEAGFGYGGSSISLYYFLKFLDKAKFDVTCAFYDANPGPDFEKIKTTDVEVITLGRPRPSETFVNTNRLTLGGYIRHLVSTILNSLLSILQDAKTTSLIFKMIAEKRFRLILFNNDIHFHIPGVIAAKLLRVPCVMRKAGIVGVRNRTNKILSYFINGVIAISEAAKRDYMENYSETKKITTIYPGVTFNTPSSHSNGAAIRKKFHIPESSKVVSMISRIAIGKGHEEVLRAASQVISDFKDVYFLIIGDDVDFGGRLLENLRGLIKELHLQDHVILSGWRLDINEILSGTDIFVHCPTTWKEALGIATLEAMAAGIPTVVSNNYGLAETTVHGETGFIVEVGDIDGISKSLLKLLKDPQLLQSMGEKARRRAQSIFDATQSTKKIEDFLTTIVTG